MGNFYGKIGVRRIHDNMKYIGPFGTGNRNERGKRLLEFAEEKTIFNYIPVLKTKQIPDSWHAAKIVILFKNFRETAKTSRTIGL